MNVTEAQAEKAIGVLKRAIDAAENSNQAGENAVVKAAAIIRLSSEELEDLFRDAISDNADMDSDIGTYAKAVVRALEKELSA